MLLLAIGILSGCHEEELLPIDAPTKGLGVRINITIPQETVVQTKGTSLEKSINDLWLLVFDGNEDDALLTDVVEAVESDRSTIDQKEFFGKLHSPSSDPRYGYLVANVPTVMGTIMETNLWKIGVTTLTDVKKSLIKTPLVTVNGITEFMPKLSPYISDIISFPDGIHSDEQIGSSSVPIGLTRITAKVTIANNTQNPDFSVIGANLVNVPVHAYLFPNMVGTTGYTIPLCKYGGADGTSNPSVEIPLVAANTSFPLYLYESPGSNQTSMIAKVTYKGISGFYKIDLTDDKGFINLLRNHHYIVNINKIEHPGYRTAQEAMNNRAQNKEVNAEIVVIDDGSHDIVSNGSEYMGVSNSEMIIYKTGAISGIEVTELNYTVRSGWNAGQITVSGAGLTLVGTNILQATKTTGRKVTVNLTDAFVTGTLTFRIGDLSRTITIRRNPTYTNEGGMITLFSQIEYVQGKITNSYQSDSWISLLPSSDSNDLGIESLVNPTGGIYLKVKSNIGFGLTLSHRQADLYIARANDKGHIKVFITQAEYQPRVIPAASRPWLGAFWRDDQKGERIIGMTTIDNLPITGTWTAKVMAGEDFIRITKTPMDFPDANGKYSDPDAENYPVTDGTTEISGTGTIYFRIGLTGDNPNPVITDTKIGTWRQPRYGYILLSVNGYQHPIFIRQGESPDYVMRPEDPINSGGMISNTRPLARKFSPFNLSDPNKSEGGTNLDDHEIIPVNGGVFTDYPSQGGYLFNFKSRRTYNPTTPNQPEFIALPTTGTTSWGQVNPVSTFVASTDETCPKGYHRPIDDSSPINSEMRQSLFLEPHTGSQSYTLTGILSSSTWGYYADGYFDRNKIEGYTGYPIGGIALISYPESVVSWGTPNVAYYGRLVYNPYTYAHIFIPAAGTRECTGSNTSTGGPERGRLRGTAQFGYLMTQSNIGGSFWFFAIGDNRATMTLAGGTVNPFTVRCVMNE